jgi:hypothetical protein
MNDNHNMTTYANLKDAMYASTDEARAEIIRDLIDACLERRELAGAETPGDPDENLVGTVLEESIAAAESEEQREVLQSLRS